ncbi:hypothetical protein Tco_0353043 [Tanacetum coccineum]
MHTSSTLEEQASSNRPAASKHRRAAKSSNRANVSNIVAPEQQKQQTAASKRAKSKRNVFLKVVLPSVSTIPPILQQSTTLIPTPPITTKASQITTILDLLHAIIQRVSKLEKYVQELKEVDNTTTLRATLKSKIPSDVHAFLGSSLEDELHKVLQRHTEEPIQKYPQQIDYKEMIENTVKNTLEKTPLLAAQSSSQTQPSLKAAESLSEYELKIILFDKMEKSHSYLTHDKHQDLYDVVFNSLSLDDAIASGQADIEKVLRKRYHSTGSTNFLLAVLTS